MVGIPAGLVLPKVAPHSTVVHNRAGAVVLLHPGVHLLEHQVAVVQDHPAAEGLAVEEEEETNQCQIV
jgi:hypothetical protein